MTKNIFLILILSIGLVACIKDEHASGTIKTSVSTFTKNSATVSGEVSVTTTGSASVSIDQRGFIYGTQTEKLSAPDYDSLKKMSYVQSPQGGEGTYTMDINSLLSSTTYYVKAFAVVKAGGKTKVILGDAQKFTTLYSPEPQLTTSAPANITANSVTLGGNIISVGTPPYTEKGVCYSTSPNPVADGSAGSTKKIISGTGTGEYHDNITGLTPNTTYYVKAYAMSSFSPYYFYGKEIQFVYPAVSIDIQSANITVQKNDAGIMNWTAANTACANDRTGGYYDWRLPNISELSTMYAQKTTISGFKTDYSGSYYWSSTPNGSTYDIINFYDGGQGNNYPSTTYNVRCVRDLGANNPPKVTTATPVNVTSSSATLSGTITAQGTYGYKERGICYGTSQGVDINNSTKIKDAGTGLTAFTTNLSALTSNTTYWVNAYVIANEGTVYYGTETNFKASDAVDVGSISIQRVDLGSMTWAAANTACANDRTGGYYDWRIPSISELSTMYAQKTTISGFKTDYSGSYYWSSTPNGSDYDHYNINFYNGSQGSGTTGSSVNVRCVRDLGANNPPKVTTATPINIKATAITLGGTITAQGTYGYKERGICYGTSQGVDINNSTKIKDAGTGLTSFTTNLSALTSNTIYWVNAYVISNDGTAYYGTETSFTTADPSTFVPVNSTFGVQKTDLGLGTQSNADAGCKASRVGGYDDWRLPTMTELSQMYNNRTTIGGFSTTTNGNSSYYWSNTASYSYSSYPTMYSDYYYNFYNGTPNNGTGTSYSGVGSINARCVRTLP